MGEKMIGAVIAFLGACALICPNSRFFRILRSNDVPLFQKRAVGLVGIGLGLFIFLND